eukprot:GHVS01036980.1.p1 GENE.GHVS01036980.1~~GHVS01036980.1.p1  ORF type:complete len:142 (+),score=23.93 GHVS01036980.1:84-509(+)
MASSSLASTPPAATAAASPSNAGAADNASSLTFVIPNEDHSLGNALRWVIMQDPSVEFCGYSVPHPSERLIALRLQMVESKRHPVPEKPVGGRVGSGYAGNITASRALLNGLNSLHDICDALEERWDMRVSEQTPGSSEEK